jgi:hypothetical protein
VQRSNPPSRRDRSAQIHEITKRKPQKNHTQTPYSQAFMKNIHFPGKFSCPHGEISLTRVRNSKNSMNDFTFLGMPPFESGV